MRDLLDKDTFVCCKCRGKFNHADGSWLPIGIEVVPFMEKISSNDNEPPKVFQWNFNKPEIVTDDKFTCYDCQP